MNKEKMNHSGGIVQQVIPLLRNILGVFLFFSILSFFSCEDYFNSQAQNGHMSIYFTVNSSSLDAIEAEIKIQHSTSGESEKEKFDLINRAGYCFFSNLTPGEWQVSCITTSSADETVSPSDVSVTIGSSQTTVVDLTMEQENDQWVMTADVSVSGTVEPAISIDRSNLALCGIRNDATGKLDYHSIFLLEGDFERAASWEFQYPDGLQYSAETPRAGAPSSRLESLYLNNIATDDVIMAIRGYDFAPDVSMGTYKGIVQDINDVKLSREKTLSGITFREQSIPDISSGSLLADINGLSWSIGDVSEIASVIVLLHEAGSLDTDPVFYEILSPGAVSVSGSYPLTSGTEYQVVILGTDLSISSIGNLGTISSWSADDLIFEIMVGTDARTFTLFYQTYQYIQGQ